MLESGPDQSLQHEETRNWVFGDNNWYSWYVANAGRRLTGPAYTHSGLSSIISGSLHVEESLTEPKPNETAHRIGGWQDDGIELVIPNKQNALHDPNRMDWSPIFNRAIAHNTTNTRMNALATVTNFDLDVDTSQVSEDILLDRAPNDLNRFILPASIDEISTISLVDVPSSTAKLSTFIRSSLRGCLVRVKFAMMKNSVAKSPAEDIFYSNLTAILQRIQADESNIDVVSVEVLLSGMQEALYEESGTKRQRNVEIIKSYLNKSLSAYGIYQGMRGVECVSTVPVHGIDTILVASGCICGLGMLALSRSKLPSAHTTSVDYLQLAIRLFFFELQYGKDRWETWYRLAQCYEALTRTATNVCELTRQSIHCYLLAISAAERDLHGFESLLALSYLYHDFGVNIANLTHLMMQCWPLDRRSTYKLAAGMFRKAINCFEGNWMYVELMFTDFRFLTRCPELFHVSIVHKPHV